ncbi:MucR family transcriptional regulator [Brucella thiophenivorans]|uniref:ROS/MUCR transcriptional regulator family protein n=1 Tax=Brucella thiophenivorans TaxID=571255 RepID=A0A256FTM7_9HYPH|nr:MucR family transcriptional regulator [Brucella thiophenivorans]OYR18232.1 ROS/MUCR transcriptional regulator family protein [Brucella thiophenivorans]
MSQNEIEIARIDAATKLAIALLDKRPDADMGTLFAEAYRAVSAMNIPQTAPVSRSEIPIAQTPPASVEQMVEVDEEDEIPDFLKDPDNARTAFVYKIEKPIIPIEGSVQHDKITCLECGAKFTNLRKHLKVAHGLTADQYKIKYGLPEDYPIVAAALSEKRSAISARTGLSKSRLGIKKVKFQD